jgi:hypothetical protein
MRIGTVLALLPNAQHAEHYRDRWRALGGHRRRHRRLPCDATPDAISGAVDAGLPRGLAGVSGSTLAVNFAGFHAAVREGMTNPTHHRRLT